MTIEKSLTWKGLVATEPSLPKEASPRKCGDWENCITYNPNDAECSKNNGCMTKENVENYLEWCKRVFDMMEKEGQL